MLTKNIIDRLLAIVGLMLSLPIMLMTGVAIAVSMPGAPVLFRQKRVGRNGRIFTMVKFRTMRPDHGGSSVSVAGESRITPLGAILRRWKIDELPELWNVVKGDMSFVGPRPDVPGYADRLSGDDRLILTLRPGITGPATLRYRHEEELLATQPDPQAYNDMIIYPDKVRINLEYLRNRSLGLDLRILCATAIPALQSSLLPPGLHALQPGTAHPETTAQPVNIYVR